MLKSLRHYPPNFGLKLLRLFPEFLSDRHHPAKLAAESRHACPLEIFRDTAWGDVWNDARMPEVIAYLLGNKYLELPSAWRELFRDFV